METPLPDAIKQALMHGDLSRLTPEQQLLLYHQTCASLGLNPLTMPFNYLELKGGQGNKKRLVLYATKGCADQLRGVRGITTQVLKREIEEGVCIVTSRSSDATGRYVDDVGVVPIVKENGEWKYNTTTQQNHFKGNGTFSEVQGEDRANVIKKCTTQANRRSTLSFCGLGMLDESELSGVADAVIREDIVPGPPVIALPTSDAVEMSRLSGQPETVLVEGGRTLHIKTQSTGANDRDTRKTLPKPSRQEVTQLMEFLRGVYRDEALVQEQLRRVLQIPTGQVWSEYRIRTEMTGEHYNALEDVAKTYAFERAPTDDDGHNIENDAIAQAFPEGEGVERGELGVAIENSIAREEGDLAGSASHMDQEPTTSVESPPDWEALEGRAKAARLSSATWKRMRQGSYASALDMVQLEELQAEMAPANTPPEGA